MERKKGGPDKAKMKEIGRSLNTTYYCDGTAHWALAEGRYHREGGCNCPKPDQEGK